MLEAKILGRNEKAVGSAAGLKRSAKLSFGRRTGHHTESPLAARPPYWLFQGHEPDVPLTHPGLMTSVLPQDYGSGNMYLISPK